MKSLTVSFLGLLLFCGVATGAFAADQAAADEGQASLLGTSRDDLLKAIGTPDEEITDAKLTQSLYDSVIVAKDEATGSTSLYFLSNKKTVGFASLDFYKATENKKLVADADALEKELTDGGFALQADPTPATDTDALYFNNQSEEYVYVTFNKLSDAGVVMVLMYTTDKPNLNSMGTVIANIDDTLNG